MSTTEHDDDTRAAACYIWEALETAATHGYWCGEARTNDTANRGRYQSIGMIYLDTMRELVRCIGSTEEALLCWQESDRAGHSGGTPFVPKAWAFVWWRTLWENKHVTRLPIIAPPARKLSIVSSIFFEYFAAETVPDVVAAAGPARSLRAIIVAQVMRATYANAYRICSSRVGGKLCLAELIATPLPVIIVSRTVGRHYKVVWVHQKALSFAKDFFKQQT